MSFNGWEEVKLKDLISSVSETYKQKSEKVVLINTSDVLEGTVLNHSFVDNKNLKGQFKKTFQRDDILYSEIRPKNKRFAYVDFDPQDYIASTKLMVLRRKTNRIDSKYLFQLMKNDSFINTLQSLAETRSGTFPQITFTELGMQSIMLPTLKEQESIAHIISTLDEKIELNNRINKTLESMAQEVFKRWFVDFEFPNRDGEPYKSSGGEMVESEQGLIPIGWKVRELGDVMSIHDSKRIPLSKNEREKLDKIYPYYGAASLMDYVDDYIFDGIYVLLGEDGTVINEDGTPVLQYVWGKFWVNNHAHVLTGAIKESTNFLYMLLKKINVRSSVTGAVQLKINQKNLCGIKIVLPEDEDLIIEYSNITEKIFEMYRILHTQNKLLSDTRNTILPKLMSGEIRVPMEEV